MATAMYLEHYLDSLESLPTELKRNFTLMADLDTRAQVRNFPNLDMLCKLVTVVCHLIVILMVLPRQDLLTKIDEEAKYYMDQAKDFSSDEKNQRIGDINKSFTKCKEYGDDKLSLAMQVSVGSI